eukprot:1102765-Prymnesium_polylepis.1
MLAAEPRRQLRGQRGGWRRVQRAPRHTHPPLQSVGTGEARPPPPQEQARGARARAPPSRHRQSCHRGGGHVRLSALQRGRVAAESPCGIWVRSPWAYDWCWASNSFPAIASIVELLPAPPTPRTMRRTWRHGTPPLLPSTRFSTSITSVFATGPAAAGPAVSPVLPADSVMPTMSTMGEPPHRLA